MLGHVMLDVVGTELTPEDRQRLLHEQTGGVILFRRNFASSAQLKALIAEIRALRDPALLIAVDHEGGRVQRFIHEDFTRLPPMHWLGRMWDQDSERALQLAQYTGQVLAYELRNYGIDFSYTPVVDLAWGSSGIIGDRAFHRSASVVQSLTLALMHGLRDMGMAACGKHFPGHGFVAEDSHTALPVDHRSLAELEEDMLPYSALIHSGLAAIMPAHVLYPNVDPNYPAGFSELWVRNILRERLGFDGVIVSDDLCMEGAAVLGSVEDRAKRALAVGCDLLLVCNQPQAAQSILDALAHMQSMPDQRRLHRLRAGPMHLTEEDYVVAKQALHALLNDVSIKAEMSTEAPMVGELC